MRSVLVESRPEDAPLVTRGLRLIWQHPGTRRYHEVGQFEALEDGRYAFGYSSHVHDIPDFRPLVQFPDFGRVYVSEVIPAFFSHRVMTRRRRSYRDYVGWLGLDEDAPPVEILARTGGGRATDNYYLVDAFDEFEGRVEGRFLVSGIRYRNERLARSLRAGQELGLRDEPTNEVNSKAVLLTADGDEIGWVPDWLLPDLHRLREAHQVRVFVDQVNEDAPPNLAVLCRLEAVRR